MVRPKLFLELKITNSTIIPAARKLQDNNNSCNEKCWGGGNSKNNDNNINPLTEIQWFNGLAANDGNFRQLHRI